MPAKLQGAVALKKAMRQFTPDLAKETTKEIASFLKPLTKNARGFLPSNDEVPSGWLKREGAEGRWAARYYDATEARRGISYKTSPSKANKRGFRALASIQSKNTGGIIYETAGRKSGITGNFTPRLGGEIKGRNQKSSGRAMYRAFDEDQGKATAGVIKAMEKAAAKFNARKANV
jgi:hypothetical protein